MKEVKVKQVVEYHGHSLSANGKVSFNLKSSYSELVNTIQLMQLLNNDVNIKAKMPGDKPIKLGSFRIKQITVNGDGSSSLKFDSLNDYVEMDNLNVLPMNDSSSKEFVILMCAEVEDENEENESEEE